MKSLKSLSSQLNRIAAKRSRNCATFLKKDRGSVIPGRSLRSLNFNRVKSDLGLPVSVLGGRSLSSVAASSESGRLGPLPVQTRVVRPIKRVLIANRGEISIRIQRACRELGIETVSVFSKEDGGALHRILSDESYQLLESDGPVSAYLNQEELLRLCLLHRIDGVHPGYGFLSENGHFADLIESHGISFIGPSSLVVQLMGDKVAARKLAIEAKIPVIPGSQEPVANIEDALEICKEIGFPVMLKAAHGGGGRGMRRVYSEDALPEAFERASSEALNAFGNGDMFVEKLITGGQHIEVQILGDLYGNIVHVLERDCSVQRRHQKVIEIAPAPFLSPILRNKIHQDALTLANYVGYQNAGTVEFLVSGGNHYFIEVNARLQVEHTVTEEVTGIDLVKSQIGVSGGMTLSDLGIYQERITDLLGDTHNSSYKLGDLSRDHTSNTISEKTKHTLLGDKSGDATLSGDKSAVNTSDLLSEPSPSSSFKCPVSIQCRITTEDSQEGFQPSTGRIDLYQPATGPGVRLDGAVGASGSVITSHFDSLLVKLITKGGDFTEAVKRAQRALSETRIRGVTTNIPFIKNVLSHSSFLNGTANVNFIDEHPELVYYDTLDMSSQHICKFLAELIVNGPHTPLVTHNVQPTRTPPPNPPHTHTQNNNTHTHLSHTQHTGPFAAGSWAGPPDQLTLKSKTTQHYIPPGYKTVLDQVGPEGFAKHIRQQTHTLLTDTTLRDAHQSLFATRMRTIDMLNIAPYYAQRLPNLFSIENWGGATFDVAYRFLKECPWKRLEKLRELIPNIPFQMLLRGANAVGYSVHADNSVYKFCEEAKKYGVDIFRIFDSLNYIDNLKLGIQAVGTAGGVVEAAISYTGDVADPERTTYTLDYYLDLAHQLNKENIHILCIKDMAGLLTPKSAAILAHSLRQNFPHLPLHFHTHDTSGCGVASMVAAAENGVDIIDVSFDSMSGLTSQPSMGAVIASLKHTSLDTQIDLKTVSQMSDYFEVVRNYYSPFECTETIKAGSSDVYEHQIPGGQYTNLHMQAFSLGISDRWPQIKQAYKQANYLLGDPPKVTPSSKVVGDMAQFMVQNNLDIQSTLEKAHELSFPSSVVEYFEGKLGQNPLGFPEPLRSYVLKGIKPITTRPGQDIPPIQWESVRTELQEKYGRPMKDSELISYVFYPAVFDEYMDFNKLYGDVSILPTANFFVGAEPGESFKVNMSGREVEIKYVAKTHLLDDGTRDVFFEVTGFPRTVNVKDSSAKTATKQNVKSDPKDPKQIGAPMPGTIINFKVDENETVTKGQTLVIISAMKMETVIVAPTNGIISSLVLKDGDKVMAGDLLLKLQ